MSITNKGELVAQILAYTHRNDLTAQASQFIDLATKRIGRDLKSQANNSVVDFAVTTMPMPLPAEFSTIRSLTYPGANGRVWVHSMPMRAAAQGSRNGWSGTPIYYSITGKNITIVPGTLGAYTLDYFAVPPALVADGDSNQVLIDHPDLYLYATLFEAFFYIQDGELSASAKAQYNEELRQINAQTASAFAGSVPAMRA